jgi:hypothetical protein
LVRADSLRILRLPRLNFINNSFMPVKKPWSILLALISYFLFVSLFHGWFNGTAAATFYGMSNDKR